MTRLRTLLLAALAGTAPKPSAGQESDWTGGDVVGKKPSHQITFGDRPDKSQVRYEFRGVYPVWIRKDQDGWLRIFDGHKEGWARKDEFLRTHESAQYFTDRLTADPNDTFAWVMRGVDRNQRGEYDAAIRDYDEAVRSNPKYAAAYYYRGLAWHAKRDFDRAVADHTEAIRFDPGFAAAFRGRGSARSANLDFPAADRDYTEAIRLSPNDPDGYNARANLRWFSTKEYDKAAADYTAVMRLEPDPESALFSRGGVRLTQGNFDQAIADYTAALRLRPYSAPTYRNRGVAWRAKGKPDQAVADFDAAIRIDKDYIDAYFYRAATRMLYRRAGAVDDFRAAFGLRKSDMSMATYAVILGTFAARQAGDEAAAGRFLTVSAGELVDAWPAPVVQFLRGECGEKTLLGLATDDGKRTEANCYLGLDHALRGRKDEAAAHFHWVKYHGTKSFLEYGIAVAELNRFRPRSTDGQSAP